MGYGSTEHPGGSTEKLPGESSTSLSSPPPYNPHIQPSTSIIIYESSDQTIYGEDPKTVSFLLNRMYMICV